MPNPNLLPSRSSEVADNIRGALSAIDRNEELIKMTVAGLTAPE